MKKSKGDIITITRPKEEIACPSKETKLKCHSCGEEKPMYQILAIQNGGPLCKKCGGYDK